MANRIQLRRDGAQQWANINPILAQGELGIEIDTSRIKIGDGVTPWNSLKYERPLETESNAANTLVKRDADGNFQAGAITATLIGNASTATRFANARQIQLTGQVTGSGSFDGSANLSLNTDLSLITTLPHYDPNNPNAEALYTRVRVNSQGRVVGAELASTLADYGITDAQGLDADLTSLSDLTTVGILVRASQGNIVTRTLTGGGGRIIFTVPDGTSQNPFIDLADTTVVVGSYNVESLTSVGTGSETVNATRFTVDRYGRLTAALTVPIATATEGSKYAAYDAGTAYSRYDIIEEGGKVYQAYVDINAGVGSPTHNTGDVSGWRYLATAATEQKGLASFAQEDFDVDANGHVSIALGGIDNTQLQDDRLIFTDGNTVQEFPLDKELTAANAHTGFDYLNYIHINDTSGNLLFSANNVDNSGAGGVDVNVDTHISGANIVLDRPGTSPLQTIERTAGSLKIWHNVSSATDRTLDIISNNAGAGTATLNITADNDITISATDVSSRVNVEDFHFQDNVLSTTNSTMVLDPNDDDGATGLVRVRGDLQVDGTTTTVNSVTMTVQDPIITLGGEDTLTSDDGLDRGVEFRYYDTQERFGFFGWDEDYTNANIWSGTGGYRFLYNATNTGEVFSGTDAPLIAGNLRLTTNTGSTSTTSGTLVVTGGAGISERLYVGGRTFISSETHVYDNLSLRADGKQFLVTTAGSLVKFSVDSDTGNTTTYGTLTAWGQTQVDDNVIFRQTSSESGKTFAIKNDTADKFTVDYTTGNSVIAGTLNVNNGVDLDNTLNVDGATDLNSTLTVDGATTIYDSTLIQGSAKTFRINNVSAVQKFAVASDTGNTDIEGTLNLGNYFHHEDTDTPTISTDANDYFIISGGDYGSFRHDGGGYIEGDTLFNNDIYINGAINQRDQGAGTETFSTQNYLRVRYKFRTGTTVAYTPNYATDGNSNLRVYGGGGIATDLHIGRDLFIGKLNSSDTIDFQVEGSTGNTVIGRVGQGTASAGTLTVHGDATFNREVDFTGSLVTVGNANTDVLTVNSVSQFTDNVTVDGNLTVNTNALIEGNLTVNGTTTTVNSTTMQLDDPVLTLGGDTAPTQADAKDRGVEFRYYDGSAKLGFFGWDNSASRYALFHNATNSSEAFSGTRSGLDVGSVKVFDTTNSVTASTGALIVGGGAGIGIDLNVGRYLNVGNTIFTSGDLDVVGDFDLGDDFRIATNKFTVAAATGNTVSAGTLTVAGQTTLQSGLGVSNNTTIGGTLGVTGATTLASTLAVTSGTTLSSTLTVAGASNVNNTLGVTGVTTITNASAASATGTYSGDGALRVTGGASIGGNLVVNSNVRVYGDSTFDGLNTYQAVQTFNDRARFFSTTDSSSASSSIASVYTAGGLAVAKKAFIGDDLNVGASNFTVDGPTGNTAIVGTLGVTGGTSLSTLTATGVADLQSTLTLGGNLTINTNKFVVNSATGSTDIAGTLDVVGATNLTSLDTSGAVDFNGANYIKITNSGAYFQNSGLSRFVNTNDSTGYNNTSASVAIYGGLSLAKRLNVGGNVMIGGSAGVKTTITASTGHITTDGNISAQGSGSIGTTLNVGGVLTATGGVIGDVTGTATNADNIDITNTNNNTTFYPTFASANTGHTGMFVDSANLTYNPFSNTLSVTNFVSTTNFEVQGNLTVTGNAIYQNSQVGDISNHDTDALAEGTTNLYFTDERVDDRVAALISGGTGISASYDDAGNLLTLSAVPADLDTDDIAEGATNLYYTNARVDARIALAAPNYATAAQGTLADSATQPGDNISTLTNNLNFIDAAGAPVQSVAGKTGTVTLVKGDVGLGNVDNTSDANKPVSTAQQTALNLKANLASPALTGIPTAPTAAQATNTTQVATTAFVQSNLTASLLRAALGIPEYATSGLATAGGLAAGDVYFNTTSSKYTTV